MRRLPVYLLLDTSGSMYGEPIEAVNTGLGVMIGALRQDPHALETVHISIITFDATAQVVLPLTALDALQVPQIVAPRSGPTHLGQALEALNGRLASDVRKASATEKGDWAPFLFIMTDGKPSDTQLFLEQSARVKSYGFASIVGCAAGPKARMEDLEQMCDHVVAMDTMDSQGFTSFFKWVTSAISGGNRSMGATSSISLPPPPPEVQVVF